MRSRLHLVIGCATTVITAAVLSLSVFFCNFAQAAEDVDYAKIGWWRIILQTGRQSKWLPSISDASMMILKFQWL